MLSDGGAKIDIFSDRVPQSIKRVHPLMPMEIVILYHQFFG